MRAGELVGEMVDRLGEAAPRLTDIMMEHSMISTQMTDEPPDRSREGLYESHDNSLTERGGYECHVAESSLYTKATMHPVATGAALTAMGLGAFFAIGRKIKGAKNSPPEGH